MKGWPSLTQINECMSVCVLCRFAQGRRRRAMPYAKEASLIEAEAGKTDTKRISVSLSVCRFLSLGVGWPWCLQGLRRLYASLIRPVGGTMSSSLLPRTLIIVKLI